MTLESATEPVDVQAFSTTWPMGAERCELLDGSIVWWGRFTEDDRARAERAFPEHVITLDDLGNIWLERVTKPPREQVEKELRSELRRGAYALR